MKWQIGDKIENRYEIHDIKMGGMAVVYLCHDLELFHRPVAVKTFQEKFLFAEETRQRFIQEAINWRNLGKHTNIVQAYSVERVGGQPYVVVEWITGGDLSDWIHRGSIDTKMGLDFGIQFCNGMVYANQKLGGIVHRDIKPQNIMIAPNKTVKITDFGLLAAAGQHAEVGAGTLPWMAPEQFSSGEIDTRTDIYSFGIVLYQMFTGGAYPYPIYTDSQEQYITNHISVKPTFPSVFNPQIPERISSLILKCLEKQPENRFQDFGYLEAQLSNIYKRFAGQEIIKAEEKPAELDALELFNKGRDFGELGKFEEEIKYCQRALKKDPNLAEAWAGVGYAQRNLGRFEEAIKSLKRALEISPKDAGTWGSLGFGYLGLKKNEDAIRCFNRALKLDENLAEALGGKGVAFHNLGKNDEAIKCYDRALAIKPLLYEVLLNKSMALEVQGKYEEAEDCINKVLAVNPGVVDQICKTARIDPTKNATGKILKGHAAYKSGNLKEAMKFYDDAIKLAPKHILIAEVWVHKGLIFDRMERYEEAIECYEKAIKIKPRLLDAWYNKGNVLGKLKMYTEAIDCYDKALDIDSKDPEVLRNKGVSLGCLQKFDEAIRCYDQALKINSKDAATWYSKAWALSSKESALRISGGRSETGFTEAVRCFNKALEINSRFAEAWYGKGLALAAMQRFGEAMVCADRAVSINPNLVDARELKQECLAKAQKEIIYKGGEEISPGKMRFWEVGGQGKEFYFDGAYISIHGCSSLENFNERHRWCMEDQGGKDDFTCCFCHATIMLKLPELNTYRLDTCPKCGKKIAVYVFENNSTYNEVLQMKDGAPTFALRNTGVIFTVVPGYHPEFETFIKSGKTSGTGMNAIQEEHFKVSTILYWLITPLVCGIAVWTLISPSAVVFYPKTILFGFITGIAGFVVMEILRKFGR